MRYLSLLAILGFAACTASTPQIATEGTPETLWRFDEHAATLRRASCPEGVAYKRAAALNIRAIDAELGSASARARNTRLR